MNVIDYANTSINSVALKLENAIYNACYTHKKVINKSYKNNIKIMDNKNVNLRSSHCHAIAKANYERFRTRHNENADETAYLPFLNQWICFQELACYKEEKEYNLKANNKWRLCEKSNSIKLWSIIDWRNKSNTAGCESIHSKIINTYFTGIFQSNNTRNNTTISDVKPILQDYNMCVPILDDDISFDEVDLAINEIGTGTSLDGLHPSVSKIFTYKLKLLLVKLLNKIHVCYPDSWKNQMLFSVTKKGHSKQDPKLQGIALSSLLPENI